MRVLLLLFLLLLSFPAFAESTHVARAENVTITLTNEPCAIKAAKNLTMKAVWAEPGKQYQGCYGVTLGGQLVLLYFDDNTMAGIPSQFFTKVREL